MYKRLLKDASLYSISSILARGFSFITVPIYTRILTPADYGALDLLSYMSVLLPLIIGLALDQAVARFYLDAKTVEKKKRIASTVLFYNIFIFLIFIPIASTLSGYLSEEWLSGQADRKTVLLVFLFIWVHSLFYIANNQLKYLFLSKKFAYCNIGNTILSTLLSFIFIVYLGWGIFGVFLGQTIGQALFAAASLYFGRNSYALVFDWGTLRAMVRYSLPLVPGTLSFYAMQYVDRYVLNELKGLSEVGIYGIGARLASLINLFLMGFQGAWHPIVMKTFREESAPQRFKTVFNHYIFITIALLTSISMFSREILLILTTAAYSQGFIVVPLLVLSAILASIAGYFTYGIQIGEKSGYRLYINVTGLLLNILLNYILIGSYGVIGAAIATVISFLFIATCGMIISQKLYKVPYDWPKILIAGLIAIGVSNIVLVLPQNLSLPLIVFKLILFFASLYFTLKLLQIKSGRYLFSEFRKNSG